MLFDEFIERGADLGGEAGLGLAQATIERRPHEGPGGHVLAAKLDDVGVGAGSGVFLPFFTIGPGLLDDHALAGGPDVGGGSPGAIAKNAGMDGIGKQARVFMLASAAFGSKDDGRGGGLEGTFEDRALEIELERAERGMSGGKTFGVGDDGHG